MKTGYSEKPGYVLHRAEWIMPVLSRPLKNGAVLENGGRIVAVDKFSALKSELPAETKILDHGRAAIMPGLVNAHTHIELSALKGAIAFPRNGFPDWIGSFFPLRAGLSQAAMLEGMTSGMREMLETGTAFCGDITNGSFLDFKAPGGFPERHVFFELLGFNCCSAADAAPEGMDPAKLSETVSQAAHSTYSVSPDLIRATKDHCRAKGMPFSIHTAEHPEEVEFLQNGGGFCRDLLERLGKWDQQWKPPGKSPVGYLDGLGVIDHGTILVHAVHVNDGDLDIAAGRGCAICFCPRSNRNMNVGRPNIAKALAFGIPACLGTDSLASNTDLGLFREAGFVLDEYPDINPETLIGMITAIPARVLGRETDFGAILPGYKSGLLAVSLDSGKNEKNLTESIIRSGEKGASKWVSTPAKS